MNNVDRRLFGKIILNNSNYIIPSICDHALYAEPHLHCLLFPATAPVTGVELVSYLQYLIFSSTMHSNLRLGGKKGVAQMS